MFRGHRFLVFVDVFSHFWDAVAVSSEGATSTCNACMKFFSAYGAPRQFRSDGGSGLQSQEFKEFLVRWGVVVLPPSSAEFPQSNGKAESAVKAFKLLKARCDTPEEYYFGLMMWRASANQSGQSPAEMFFGRSLSTPLLRAVQNLVPWEVTREKLEENKRVQKEYFDRSAREAPTPSSGEVVQVKVEKKRVAAEVVGPAVQPRAVVVQLPSGRLSTQNRQQLRVLPNQHLSFLSMFQGGQPGPSMPPAPPGNPLTVFPWDQQMMAMMSAAWLSACWSLFQGAPPVADQPPETRPVRERLGFPTNQQGQQGRSGRHRGRAICTSCYYPACHCGLGDA
jgi:hypothetical protein